MNRIKKFTPRTATGLSLIELMISIALVAIILAGVVKLYADSQRSFLANEGVARTQESIRYVLDHISRSASRAGYMGCGQLVNKGQGTSVENYVNTGTDAGRLYDFAAGPVFGTDDDGANNSDTLILRSAKANLGVKVTGADSGSVTLDAAELAAKDIDVNQGDVVIASNCDTIRIFMVTNNPNSSNIWQHSATTINGLSNTSIAADDRHEDADSIFQDITVLSTLFPATGTSFEYSIGDSAAGVCAAATPQFCALLANGEELLQGVEDLQVLYGQRSAGGGSVRYREADDAAIDWQEVVSVQLTITLNSVDNAFSRQADPDVGDGLVRKTVTHVVALRNGDL